MAINFPDSPSVNDTHIVGNKTWTWDGTKWNASFPTKSIDDLNDVVITTVADGQTLIYDLATTSWINQDIDALPDQTNNSGKYLTTDGTTASWAILDIPSTAVSETAPVGPEEGDAWFRSSTGQFFVYYDSYWVEIGAGPQGEPGVVAAVAPLSYDAGTQSISIDLSSYYTSAETDAQITTAVSVKKTEIVQEVSSDINVLAGYRYVVDTTASRNLTLPATPAVGDEIQFIDASGQAETYITNVLNNGNLINGTMDYLMLNMNFYNARLIYTGATYGWRVS